MITFRFSSHRKNIIKSKYKIIANPKVPPTGGLWGAIIIFACLFIISFSNVFSSNYKAYRTQTLPVIDGIASESCWKYGSWAYINQPFDNKTLPDSTDFYGRYKVVWDAARLYILMEITDDKLVDNRAIPTDNYWEDDIAEIFIDEDRMLQGHGCGKEAFNAFAYHISAVPRDRNNYTIGSIVPFDAVNAVHHVIDLGEDCNTANALNLNDHVKMKIFKNGNKYTWEMEFKVFDKNYNQNINTNIPVTLTPNKVMGFAIAYCDDDSGVRDNMIGTVPAHFDYGGTYPLYRFTNEFETLTLIDSALVSPTAIHSPTILSVIAQQKKPIYLDNNQPLELRVKDALSRMTLEEKVKLCTAQSIFSSNGVPRLGIPEIWMSDGPHGVRMENLWAIWEQAHWTNDSCTAFPALTCLAATWNPEMSLIYGITIGEEARYRNKEVLLGPGVNIYRTPLNGRNFEYLGEDPYLASKMVVPYIQGVQQNGVAACVKHFALNNQEKWRHNINVELSDRALNEIYLPAFKAAVTEGKAWAIMGAYNKIRGEYACHNNLMLNKILKDDWKFDGCVISDWGGTHDTKQAILNGLDIEMGTETDGLSSRKAIPYEEYCLANPYLKMLKSGEIPLSNIEDKASRILRLIFRTSMDANKPYGSLATEEHHKVGRKVAEEGIVLLQNSAKLLPIDASKYNTIAVIGENATRKLTVGGGSSELKVKREVSPLQGFIEKFGAAKVKYTLGYASAPVSMNPLLKSNLNADSLRLEAVKLASESDIVIFVGGLNKNVLQDCESDDRRSYSLPFGQNELIAELQNVNKKIVLVMLSGNAYETPWIKQSTTLVQAWYLGSEAGHAIANVLSGEVTPSGKLPFTFPVKLSDNGAHSFGAIAYPGDTVNVVYKDDILVGYRWHDTKKIAPQFPFGFGLSYTTFAYGKVTTDKQSYSQKDIAKLSMTLKNTGKVKGHEVVQIYISDEKSTVLRPVKELKAFSKIELNAGESKSIEIDLPVKDWAFYNDKTNQWEVETGKFTILVGASSSDIRQKKSVMVE